MKTLQKILGLERVRCVANKNLMKGIQMKLSEYKSYDELPLFLSSAQAPHPSLPAKAESSSAPLCLLSPQSQRTALRGPSFSVLKVGSRMVVPKEKFMEWVEQHTGGGSRW